MFQAKCRANKTAEEKDAIRQKDKEKRADRRAHLTTEEKDAMRQKNKERRANRRAHLTTEEKDSIRQKNKEKRANRRAHLTTEEREALQEKDRLRKKKKNLEKKKCTQTYDDEVASQPSKPSIPYVRAARPRIYIKNEKEHNKQYKRRMRKGRSEAEIEYEKVDILLQKRKARKARDGKQHLLDNLRAKQGMRDLKEHGRVIGSEFMRRAKRAKDEEVLWWSFWKKGKVYRDLLKEKRLMTAELMEAKEAYIQNKEEERKRIDADLDSKGRWILDCGEYYWSIPDENGQRKSLIEYEAECEANEPKLTAEEEAEKEEKQRKEREE